MRPKFYILNLKLNSASPFPHKYHIRADYNNILPADGELLAPAKETAHTLTAENGYAHKTACAGVNFNVGHAPKAATVINVHNLFCSQIGYGTLQKEHLSKYQTHQQKGLYFIVNIVKFT